MTQSNEEWGDLTEHDDELGEVWDRYSRLPEPGESDVLDAFVESKHLDIPALVRLGARIGDSPTVLAFAFPGGIKYRDMEQGRKWTYTGSAFTRLKIVRAATPTDTVVVSEGETDGARLSMLYPQCDVAVIPAGAKRWTAAFTDQLATYDRVVVALDNDTAGGAGWEKIKAALPHAARLVPPENPDNDWCGLPADVTPPPLPDPDAESVGGIVFTDLAYLLEHGVPEPEVLVDDVLYTEGVHLLSGHPGCGKTTFAAFVSFDAMTDKDRHVVWLDYESGTRQTVRRMLAMDVPHDLLLERFHYSGWPTEAEKYLNEIAARWPGALIVLDSMSKALSQAGIDENSNTEVTAWTAQLVRGCKDNSLPVLIIDHISKPGEKSDYSRGAGSKLADVDVHWRVIKEEDFSRTQIGTIQVQQKKDREGYLPPSTWWRVGDGAGNLTLLPTDGPINAEEEDENVPAI